MSGSAPSAGGQAPESGQPQAGTPPAQAAIPAPGAQAPAFPANTGQPKYQFNSPEEVEAFAQRLIADRQEANRKEREVKGELKALQEQVQFLVVQQKLAQQQAIAANVQLAAKNAGFKHPDFVYGAIAGQLQYDQAGNPTNVQAILDALKVRIPELLEAQQQPQGALPAQPGQPAPVQPQGQPAPQLPEQPQGSPGNVPAPQQQPRTGVMNAPQSSTTVGGELTWDVIQANISNPAWVAQNEAKLEAFMANPLNHQHRPR